MTKTERALSIRKCPITATWKYHLTLLICTCTRFLQGQQLVCMRTHRRSLNKPDGSTYKLPGTALLSHRSRDFNTYIVIKTSIVVESSIVSIFV